MHHTLLSSRVRAMVNLGLSRLCRKTVPIKSSVGLLEARSHISQQQCDCEFGSQTRTVQEQAMKQAIVKSGILMNLLKSSCRLRSPQADLSGYGDNASTVLWSMKLRGFYNTTPEMGYPTFDACERLLTHSRASGTGSFLLSWQPTPPLLPYLLVSLTMSHSNLFLEAMKNEGPLDPFILGASVLNQQQSTRRL